MSILRKFIFLYKTLHYYTAPNLKESLIGGSLMHANYNLRNTNTDMPLPKPRRELLKKVLNIVGQSFGTAFLGKQKSHDLFTFSKKLLIINDETPKKCWILYRANSIYK